MRLKGTMAICSKELRYTYFSIGMVRVLSVFMPVGACRFIKLKYSNGTTVFPTVFRRLDRVLDRPPGRIWRWLTDDDGVSPMNYRNLALRKKAKRASLHVIGHVARNIIKVAKIDLDFTKPIQWVCPGCGQSYLTPELQPRCSQCGYQEGTG